ncbi:MAG: hypothetical protein V3T48_11150 [Vicinamibacterales bacterium]
MPLVVLLGGCMSIDTIESSEISASRLHGVYTATYEQADRTLTLGAEFRVGGRTGTTVRLVPPAQITVDGQHMREYKALGTHYSLERRISASDLPYEVVFVWTRADGEAFTNRVELPSSARIVEPAPRSAHSRLEDLIIVFADYTPVRGEKITVKIKGRRAAAEGVRSHSVRQTYPASGRVRVLTDELRGFMAGSATVSVTRHITRSDASGHDVDGGRLVATYEAQPIEIGLTD